MNRSTSEKNERERERQTHAQTFTVGCSLLSCKTNEFFTPQKPMHEHVIGIQSFSSISKLIVNCIITSITEVFVFKGCFDFRQSREEKERLTHVFRLAILFPSLSFEVFLQYRTIVLTFFNRLIPSNGIALSLCEISF